MSYFSRIYLLSLHITKTKIFFLPDSLFYFYPQYLVKRLKKEV